MKLIKVFILLCFLTCIAKAQNIDTLLTNRKLTQINFSKETTIIHLNHCVTTVNEKDFPIFYINKKIVGKSFTDKYFIEPHSIRAIDVIKKMLNKNSIK